MADLVIEFLERLEQTKGDPHAQSAVAAEFALAARPEAEREPLRAALDAAALLHWFDARLLHKVLGIPEEEAANRFKALKDMPFVEQYRRGEHDLRNVHESTRLGWRKQLAHADGPRFRLLSKQASDCFAADLAPAAQIERIYHLLCADPEAGASGLETLNRQWSSSAYPEDRYALAAVLKELEDSQLLAGRARAWALLVIAWARDTRGETAQLQEVATAALLLARQTKDQSAEGDAQALLGDVLQVQGKLEEAQVAFGEYLAISRRLAAQDPGNACWQRVLAAAHNRVGDVWQAQGKLEEAQAAYAEYLAISRRLAAQDPSNAGWQRDLAVTCVRLARVEAIAGRDAAALPFYEEASRIFGELAVKAPGFAQWAKEKELVEAELAQCQLKVHATSSPGSATPEGPSASPKP